MASIVMQILWTTTTFGKLSPIFVNDLRDPAVNGKG